MMIGKLIIFSALSGSNKSTMQSEIFLFPVRKFPGREGLYFVR